MYVTADLSLAGHSGQVPIYHYIYFLWSPKENARELQIDEQRKKLHKNVHRKIYKQNATW